MTYNTNGINGKITETFAVELDSGRKIPIKITDSLTAFNNIEESYAVYAIKDKTLFFIDGENQTISRIIIEDFEKINQFVLSNCINLGSVENMPEFFKKTEGLFFSNIYSIFVKSKNKTYIYSPTFSHKVLAL